VYSHRSTYLHTMGALTADSLGARESDRIMPVVPMFHANAWGLAHAGVAAGADLVMPGPDLSGKALADLIVDERVTVAAGVPTIWMQVLPELKGRDTSSLRAIPCGGSAVPRSLSEGYRKQIGLPILHAWGMTETSPVAAVCRLDADESALDDDVQADLRTTVGRILFGVECRVVEPDSTVSVPRDATSSGELQCRGPWIAASYYHDPKGADSFTADGWLRTGDVATWDERGRIKLVDRTKDLIKSGGEWISSVELENELMAHPMIREAAVIGIPDPKWSERPLACVVLEDGADLSKQDVLDFLAPKVAKWQLPDDVVFIDEVPKTSVGKFSKKTLRERFAAHVVPR
jgi:fatty-acyl-CoA synthase